MRKINPSRLVVLACVCMMASCSFAETLSGTVKNSTTNHPASGDDVVLLKLGDGMEEAGHTKTDGKGNFTLKLSDTQSPHLVRVIHQGVTYHRMAPPGTTSVEVEVYDVGEKIDGIATAADVVHFETNQGRLEVQRLFAVDNSSQPKRTQMNDRSFEFYLPDGVKIIQGSAMTANGQPIALVPVPEGHDGKYAFAFPLRPGETRFEVDYELPYSGTAAVSVRTVAPVQQFIVIAPKTMQFSADAESTFQAENDPQSPGVLTEVAANVAGGESLSFHISGEGTLPPESTDANAQADSGNQGTSAAANAPGGGLGPPIDAPDPLQKYRWYILGGSSGALLMGAVVVARRQQSANANYPAQDDPPRGMDLGATLAYQIGVNGGGLRVSNLKLLAGLKDEYFALEVEHKRGSISDCEYATTKAALDQTLQRALKRNASAVEN